MKLLSRRNQILALSTFLFTMLIGNVFSQSWSVLGNSTQVTPVLGTINCSDVSVRTSNNERLRLYCNGLLRAGGNTQTNDTNANANMVFGSDVATARLDVNGIASSINPVINAKVRYAGNKNIYAIQGQSRPAVGYGYGAYLDGGRRGVSSNNDGGSYSGSTYGVYANSTGSAGSRIASYNYCSTTGSATTYGVYAYSYSTGSGSQYSVYSSASNAGTGAKYAGYFNGTVYVTTLVQGSDRKLKENIVASKDVLPELLKLKPSAYTFKKEYVSSMHMPENKQYGLIADEVEKVFPELVSENVQAAQFDPETEKKVSDEIHFKAINYVGLIPLVIEGVKEQQNDIEQVKGENEELKAEVAALKSRMAQIENMLSRQEASVSIKNDQSITSAPYLEQNAPNPFKSETRIKYKLGDETKHAVLNVYGANPKPILTFNLENSLNGLIVLQAGTWPAGEYTYELVVNGKRVDSKKMILTR